MDFAFFILNLFRLTKNAASSYLDSLLATFLDSFIKYLDPAIAFFSLAVIGFGFSAMGVLNCAISHGELNCRFG